MIGLLPLGAFVGRWVLHHVNADMRLKVSAYMAVITVMVATAAGTELWLLTAATLFYASDLCVARQRFVQAGFVNRLIGLPLYYAAQWMFALAAAAV